MAVIYVPQNPDNLGAALGSGVSQGMSSYAEHELKRQEQQKQMQVQMQAMNAVKTAGSREKALSILTTPGAVNNPQELANAFKFVDALYPPRDETPEKVTGFDQKTGAKTERFVRKSDLPSLNDPKKAESVFGPGIGLTEPNLTELFDPDSGRLTGKKPLAQKGVNEVTEREFQNIEKKKADERAASTQERAAKASERAASASERAASTQERLSHEADLKAQQAYTRMVADSLNIKKVVGADGSFNLDFEGDDRKKAQYYKMLDLGEELLPKYKGDVLKAANAARKQVVGDGEPKPKVEPPKVDEPKKGAISDLVSKLTGKKKDEKTLEMKDGYAVVKTDEDYGRVKSGDTYWAPDGKLHKKK